MAYLGQCIASWRRSGFDPVSVNRPDEADAVAAMGLIEVWPADQSEAKQPDKFGPCLGSIFDLLNEADPVAIINADIFMLPRDGLAQTVAKLLEDRVIAARRTDVDSMDGVPDAGRTYRWGYDFFAFKPCNVPNTIASREVRSFQLGAPWWDYVLPISCAAEIPASRVKEPFILHQLHEERWNPSLHKTLSFDACEALSDVHECFEILARNKESVSFTDDVSLFCDRLLFAPGFYEVDVHSRGPA